MYDFSSSSSCSLDGYIDQNGQAWLGRVCLLNLDRVQMDSTKWLCCACPALKFSKSVSDLRTRCIE